MTLHISKELIGFSGVRPLLFSVPYTPLLSMQSSLRPGLLIHPVLHPATSHQSDLVWVDVGADKHSLSLSLSACKQTPNYKYCMKELVNPLVWCKLRQCLGPCPVHPLVLLWMALCHTLHHPYPWQAQSRGHCFSLTSETSLCLLLQLLELWF